MIKAKQILGFLFVSLALIFASCEDDTIDKSSTHTDVSGLVVGTYTGTISLDTTASYSDVTVVIEKYEADSVQAVTIVIQSSSFDYSDADSLYLPAFINTTDKIVETGSIYLNVAKANDGYVFSCSNSAATRLNGRLNDNDLYLQIPIKVYKNQTAFHTNGDDWDFYGTKN